MLTASGIGGATRRPSDRTVDEWREKADVFIRNEHRTRPGALPGQFIALDLGYESTSPTVVWSVCAQTVGVEHPHRLTVFADANHQGQVIGHLASFLANYPGLPVVTWAGTSADLSVLRKIGSLYPLPETVDIDEFLDALHERHLELLQWTKQTTILPLPGMGLKDVPEYLGLENDVEVADGFGALFRWRRYLRTRDVATRRVLIDYNRSDVATLIEVAAHLRHAGPPGPSGVSSAIERDEVHYHETPLRAADRWRAQLMRMRRVLFHRHLPR